MRNEESRQAKIKHWSPDDRPREKLLKKGATALSEAELVAILIVSGTPTQSAVDVARKVLLAGSNTVQGLARLSIKDLMKIRGIGVARAITIAAALELGRRRKGQEKEETKISSSRDAFLQISGDFLDLQHEEFWVLVLNRANRVVRKKKVSEGGVSGTVADPRIIFRLAIEELASGIIVVHNHPSGNLTASQSDIDLTRKLRDAGKFLDIQLLDHLIVAGQKYFSFADEGML